MEKVLQELFGHILLDAHTVQTVTKYIWMWYCLYIIKIAEDLEQIIERHHSL